MVTDAKSDKAKGHPPVWMRHGNEHPAEPPVLPRDVGLHAAAEPSAIAAFRLASHQMRLRNSAQPAHFFLKGVDRYLSVRRQMREILRQGVIVKADREDRLGPGFGH